jgi:alpha 1,3-mannosyltransferase
MVEKGPPEVSSEVIQFSRTPMHQSGCSSRITATQHPMKYLWTSALPKEGRSLPSGLGLHNRRRTAILRLFVLFLTVVTIYWTITSSSKSSDLVKPQPKELLNLRKPLADRESASDQTPPIDNEPTTQKSVLVKVPHTPNVPRIPADQHVPDRVPSEDDTATKPQSITTGQKSDPRLEAALAHVILLLPNEITARELLRPVEGTGEEKLREMGLRARAFKTYFEAWEALHFVSSGDDMYIRDDVIQYLRSRQDFASSLTLSFAETIRSYESYRYFLQRLSSLLFPWTAPYFANHMTLHTHFKNGGRGIVLSCGDIQAPYLLTSMKSFRQLGCTLPIEVMYLGDSDLSEDYRAEMELIPGVITRDMSQMVTDEGWQLEGWAGKPFAILLSSFREAIFIDADALFFKDPEILFDDPSYAETGTLFFRDRIIMPESKKRWLKQVLPDPISKKARQSRYWTGQSGHMQESGVVVVDKSRHFVALLMVTRMNGPDRDGNEEKNQVGVYDMVYGKFCVFDNLISC